MTPELKGWWEKYGRRMEKIYYYLFLLYILLFTEGLAPLICHFAKIDIMFCSKISKDLRIVQSVFPASHGTPWPECELARTLQRRMSSQQRTWSVDKSASERCLVSTDQTRPNFLWFSWSTSWSIAETDLLSDLWLHRQSDSLCMWL